MRLPMKSTAGPEKASGYDRRWRSTASYSSTTPSTQPSFINFQVMHFTFESAYLIRAGFHRFGDFG